MFLQKNITLVEHSTEINDNFIRNSEKKRIKSFLFQRYENEIDRPQNGIICWSVNRFT